MAFRNGRATSFKLRTYKLGAYLPDGVPAARCWVLLGKQGITQ